MWPLLGATSASAFNGGQARGRCPLLALRANSPPGYFKTEEDPRRHFPVSGKQRHGGPRQRVLLLSFHLRVRERDERRPEQGIARHCPVRVQRRRYGRA